MSIAMREKITFVTLDQWLWYESYVQEDENSNPSNLFDQPNGVMLLNLFILVS